MEEGGKKNNLPLVLNLLPVFYPARRERNLLNCKNDAAPFLSEFLHGSFFMLALYSVYYVWLAGLEKAGILFGNHD